MDCQLAEFRQRFQGRLGLNHQELAELFGAQPSSGQEIAKDMGLRVFKAGNVSVIPLREVERVLWSDSEPERVDKPKRTRKINKDNMVDEVPDGAMTIDQVLRHFPTTTSYKLGKWSNEGEHGIVMKTYWHRPTSRRLYMAEDIKDFFRKLKEATSARV